MRATTDMDGVRHVAKVLLNMEIVKTKFSPMVVQHPFTNSAITMLYDANGNPQIEDLLKEPDKLAKWRDALCDKIDLADNVYDIFAMLNKPYVLTFLKYAQPYLSHKEFSELLGVAWIGSEAPNKDANASKKELVAMFKQADLSVLMDDVERTQLAELDDVVTVYRGVTSHNAKNIRALSWTLSYDTADWFAQRFHESGTVYEAQIKKEHILALFLGRGEKEIVLDPKYLKDIAPAQVQENNYDMKLGGM